MTHLGGRPTKYRKELCDLIMEYFDKEPYREVDIDHYKNGEVAWTDKKLLPNKLPTMVGFWRWLNKEKGIEVGLSSLYDWINPKHASYQERFSDAFTHAKKLQKDNLIQSGLIGVNNPIFSKFVATNLTDMRDKVDTVVKGDKAAPVSIIIRGDDAKL